MNMEECYALLQGDYAEAITRLMTPSLVERFSLRFLDDHTMDELRAALAANDIETAFRAAHTLKGVAGNLSFTDLQTTSSALTEALRSIPDSADPALVQAVEESYERTVAALKQYQAEK